MPRTKPQLNIRSAIARERAAALSRETGLTTTQVVEAALLSWTPDHVHAPNDPPPPPPGMVRKGWLLVMTSRGDRKITLEETNAAIEADRNERGQISG